MNGAEVIEHHNSAAAQQVPDIRNVSLHNFEKVAAVDVGKPDRSILDVLAHM